MHPLYRDKNKQFYGILEEATHGTTYEASIKHFHRAINGCGSYLAMIAQHTERDKWIIVLQYANYFINNRRWDGTTKTLLQSHIEQCLEFYVVWETLSHHINFWVPNELTRVQILLDSIYGCTDPKMCVRMAAVSNEALGMIDNFELAFAHLLPT